MGSNRIFLLLICALILPMLTNCSILLHSTRKSTSDLIKTESTREELRKTFGGVVSSVDYRSAIRKKQFQTISLTLWVG